jgi:hypothetical protein
VLPPGGAEGKGVGDTDQQAHPPTGLTPTNGGLPESVLVTTTVVPTVVLW